MSFVRLACLTNDLDPARGYNGLTTVLHLALAMTPIVSIYRAGRDAEWSQAQWSHGTWSWMVESLAPSFCKIVISEVG
jgi:hypothetical protein